jgi:nitronate monooxygenase
VSILERLGVQLPVVAAPMAGGPSTPGLVVAAGLAGSFGFLAGGYKTAAELGDQVEEVRGSGVAFGVNLFVPQPVPVDPLAYAAYADEVGSIVPLREDDDAWEAKVALLLAAPVPLVSFTFGLPAVAVLDAFRAVGTYVVQTVTSLDEARQATAAGVDALVVQSARAGGHSGTFSPDVPVQDVDAAELVARVREVVDLPLWAAGGVAEAHDVRRLLDAGAEAVAIGTLLLLSPEAGTSATYRSGLADPGRTETVLTRAFSGRPARGLRNGFIDAHDATAPSGYPAIHHLTTPLRRAAAAAGDPERINLWAGTGFARATAEPAGEILRRLAGVEPHRLVPGA